MIQRKRSLAYSKLIKIKIKGAQGVQFVGQFNFSDLHREAHNQKYTKESEQIFIADIGELAFGRFIFSEPERKRWFKMLQELISKKNGVVMKDLIDDVRKKVGRDPAIEPSYKFPEYWIITPPGSLVDTHGNTNKIRHAQKGRLNKSQVELLKSIGFDILNKNNFTFQQLKSMFPNLGRWS